MTGNPIASHDSAREYEALPASMRADVRTLGSLLGEIIAKDRGRELVLILDPDPHHFRAQFQLPEFTKYPLTEKVFERVVTALER